MEKRTTKERVTKERTTEKGIREPFTPEIPTRDRSARGSSTPEKPPREESTRGRRSREASSREASSRDGRPRGGSSREGSPEVGNSRGGTSSGGNNRTESPMGGSNKGVPIGAGRTKERSLTIMERKFLLARGRALEPDRNTAPDAFRKQHYFFYGSLTDASTLSKVLRLQHPPELQPAHIIGYRCKYRGPYPALLDGPPGAIVKGKAYVVQTPLEEKCLEAYETERYKSRPCLMTLQDGSEVDGCTFVWNGDKAELKEATLRPSKTGGSRSRESDRIS